MVITQDSGPCYVGSIPAISTMKQRKFPNKPQNKYGNKCSLYEADGGYYCPAYKKDMSEILQICKGNRHNCCKVLYKLEASIKK